MTNDPFESANAGVARVERILDETLLSTIPVIKESAVAVRTREDLEKLIEAPLLDACQMLYDKNIKTLMSSANSKDVGGVAYIDIDFDSLSDENKKIALRFGQVEMMHGSKPTPCIKIAFPVTSSTTVGDIRRAAEVVTKFKKQPLTWGRFTREQLAKTYGMSVEDVSPQDWAEEFPYDETAGYFYESAELLSKAKEPII